MGFSLFRKQSKPLTGILKADIHSHLIPGIDDGSSSMEESIELLKGLINLGYQKVITTPHIMPDFYPNTPEIIESGLLALKAEAAKNNLDIKIEAAAEYYFDEKLLAAIEKKEPLLTFGGKHLLFETPFFNEPVQLKDLIFALQTQGYKPVLAHPERYAYLNHNKSLAEDLINRGVLFQVNINSLYSGGHREIRQMAEYLIKKGWVHFLGSDCHNLEHLELLKKSFSGNNFKNALRLPIINNQL